MLEVRERGVAETASKVIEILAASAGSDYIGEPVSQLEHALQCAHFARKAGGSDELVLAALLHDIGHLIAGPDTPLMADLGVADHESLGADFLLSLGFQANVAELVRGHVQGKRYLTHVNPAYLKGLSEASRGTLLHQGGPMTADEAARFEADPLFHQKIQLRKLDEVAKQTDLKTASLEEYRPLIERHLNAPKGSAMTPNLLTPEQMRSWDENGFILLKGHYQAEMRERLKGWVEKLGELPETAGKWMKYFEKGPAGERLLCRVENFVPYETELGGMLTGGEMLSIVSQLMGEQAILFKEKINYKLPGGKGFTPHQDAPAFVTFNQKYHITLMISVDATTPENGCLEVVRGWHKRGTLPQEKDGSMDAALCKDLRWEPVTTEPGDVLLFDSYIPHRSGSNTTLKPRRAYYITYNRASEGDRRNDYYADKRDKFPPDVERIPGKDYSAGAAVYNLANPIDK